MLRLPSTGPVEDTCDPLPRPKNITLPETCIAEETNKTSVDVGECKPVPCMRNSSTARRSCEEKFFCCSPKLYAHVGVRCAGNMYFNVTKIIRCGCDENCTAEEVHLKGQVLGPDGRPMQYGDVKIGDRVETYTDRDGFFSVEVPKETKRMTLTFVDERGQELESRTRSFSIQQGTINFYKIVLSAKEPPVSFNASEPKDISMGHSSENQSSFADLEIPANALISEDGQPFTGQAKVRLSVTDPRNQSDVQSAPGDFSAVDEDGEQQLLETFGMIKMNFEDENNNPLAVSKPMKIFIDPEQVNMTVDQNGNVSAKLYWLDEQTGRWREAGNIWAEDGGSRRRKRDVKKLVIVAEVLPIMSRRTLNFDTPSRFTEVRIKAASQSTVRVFRKDSRGYVEKATNRDGLVCLGVWRDADCYLQVEKNGKFLEIRGADGLPKEINPKVPTDPDNPRGPKQTLAFRSVSVPGGPIYSYGQCNTASNQKEIQFFEAQGGGGEDKINEKDLRKRISYVPDTWFTEPGIPDQKRCYLKITLRNAKHPMTFVAESFSRDDWKTALGVTSATSIAAGSRDKPNEVHQVLCVEFRCPPAERDGKGKTNIIVSPLTGNCKPYHSHGSMNPKLSAVQQQCSEAHRYCKDQKLAFCVPEYSKTGRISHGTWPGFNGVGAGDLAWRGCMQALIGRQHNGNALGEGRPWDPKKATFDDEDLVYDCS